MNRRCLGGFLASVLGLAACGPTTTDAVKTELAVAPAPHAVTAAPHDTLATEAAMAAQVREITSSYTTWYSYAYFQVPLFQRFAALGVKGQPLPKKSFLQRLATGQFVALQRGIRNGVPVYQLYAYAGPLAEIKTASQQLAQAELYNYDREGKLLPPFKLVDLQGVAYTPASTKGKVLVLKCWFIHCVGCVKEFPEVNALVAKYQANKNVLFISLATDDAAKLRAFLPSHPLRYAVVPNSEGYMQNKLLINGYPTHLVVGRDGKITYVANSPAYLAVAIEAALQPAKPLAAQ